MLSKRLLAGILVLVAFSGRPAYAQRLPAGVRPEHYDLAFDVDLPGARFNGTETIKVRLDRASSRIVLHALDIEFQEVVVRQGAVSQNATVTLDKSAQTAVLSTPKPVNAGLAEIGIRYSGTLNDQLRGFYLSKANGRSYAVTQLESTDARRAFPSFDEPALKATFAISLTIERNDTAISNGRLLEDRPGPGADRHTLRFATTPRMSSYLVAMAVGDFECLESTADRIPIRVCATPDKKDLGRLALGLTGDILAFYNRYYDIKYPFGKLDMVAIPDFAAGAMENTGAIFYRETDLLASEEQASVATRKRIATVIAHETAHQWFGDLVTMRWWDDLWLNEGFASWMETRPLAAMYPDWNIDVDESIGTETALTLDALKATRPIHSNAESPAEIEETFDAIAYQKGAAVLRMIERFVGANDFRTGVNTYLARHAYGNATSEDFWRAIAAASKKPVDRVLPTFVNQPGVPLLDVSLACAGSSARITVRQQRFANDPSQAAATAGSRWQIPICVKSSTSPDASCTEVRETSLTITEASCPSWVFINTGAAGYFRTAYPPSMLPALAANLTTALTSAERLSLAGDEWALVRAGRHTVADYLTLASGFGGERSSGVLDEVVTRLTFIHDYIATESQREPLSASVRSLLRPLYDQIGLTARGTESDDQRALRAVVVDALGRTGNDPGILADVRTLVDRAIAGTAPLDSTMASTALGLAARHGDRALFDTFVAAARTAATPEEYYRYLGALSSFEDPALVRLGLERLLSDEVRGQDAGSYLRGFLANPNAGVNRQAWSFVKEHAAKVLPKVSISFGDATVVGSLGSFCDADTRDDIKRFFTENPRPAATRGLEQTIERINNCIDLKAKQQAVLSAWLAKPATR